MRICDLKNKEVINVCDCKSLGCVVDIDFHVRRIVKLHLTAFKNTSLLNIHIKYLDTIAWCDLGIDQIKLYEFDHKRGKLKLYDIIRSQLESAPRQMVFSPDGRFAYVLLEISISGPFITIKPFSKWTVKSVMELVSWFMDTVRKGHKNNSAASHLIISNSGNNLICSNAGDNTVTIYSIDSKT